MMARPDRDDRPTLFQRSVARFQLHPALVSIFAAVGLVAGLGLAEARPTSYQADCRMLVGTFEAPSQAIPGYVLASQQVAADYARVAMSQSVLTPVSQTLALPVDELRARVTVTAIPESAVIRVVGEGDGPDAARTVAEGMCAGLQTEVDRLNGDQGRAAELEALHSQASQVLAEAEVTVADAQRAVDVARPGGNVAAIAQAQAALNDAVIKRDDAKLRVDGFRAQYLLDQQRASTSSQIRQLGGASVKETSTLYTRALFGMVGLLVGLGIGLALAARKERHRVRKVSRVSGGEGTARPAGTRSPEGGRREPTPDTPPVEVVARPGNGRRR